MIRMREPGYERSANAGLRRALPRSVALCLCLGFALSLSPWVRAQAPAGKSRVVTISEVTIVGRIQKPIAAVDVSRIQPKLTLAELRQPFLQRIEAAVYRSPF
jgi:hypothetical protein